MLRTAVLFLIAFAGTRMNGQVTGIEQTRLNTLKGWKIRVENTSPSAIVGMHVDITCPGVNGHGRASELFSIDPVLHLGTEHILPPGGFLALDISDSMSTCPGGVDAVLFADGHSSGDPAEVKALFDNRIGAVEALESILPMLQNIATLNVTAKQVASTLHMQDESLRLNRVINSAERDGERYILSFIASLLESQHELYVPSFSTNRRRPGVEETMKTRGFTHEQAHALVLQLNLQEWLEALQSSIPLPVQPAMLNQEESGAFL